MEEGMDVDKFRARLHVLAVDDDRVSLMLIARQLQNFNYNVTTAMHADTALEMLRARKNANQFDLVITDVHMPGMDGFKLLELIGLEMDIPVIMLSANDSFGVMMKGINHGARDYLVKPVRVEQIKNLWIHVVRKSKGDQSNCNNGDNNDNVQTLPPENIEGENCSDHTMYSRKKKKDEDDTEEDKDSMSTQKKQRIQWSGQLHRKFVEAVNQIGLDKAGPKKILEIMNVEGISRENVASHLQKYRLYLKKLSNGTYKCANPFAEEARLINRKPINMNGLQDFEHSHEHGRYQPSPSFAGSSNSGNPFARMNSPSAFGTHGLLPTQSVRLMTQRNLGIPLKHMGPVGYGGNLPQDAVSGSHQGVSNFIFAGNSNANICFPSGPSRSSFENISNGLSFNTNKSGPSGTSGNSFTNISNGGNSPLAASVDDAFLRPFNAYASLLRGKFEGASRGIPFDADDSFADGEMLAPSSNLPVQPPESAALNAGLSDSFNNSWKPAASSNFPDLGHKGGTSEEGPSQGNRRKINKLSRLAASSGQISEFQNQMAALMRTITPGFNEQVPAFNMGSNTNPTTMPNDYSAPTDASSAISTSPNLQMNNSTMPNQMLNFGGASGSRTDNDGTDDQQAVGDQLNNNNKSFAGTSVAHDGMSDDFDDFFDDWLNQDVLKNGDAFMDEDWEFAP